MTKSILGSEKGKCYVCGREGYTERHHIYGGPNRAVSEREGFVVDLCYEHHRGTMGVHFNKNIMDALHKGCQRLYEEDHTREEFMALIGRNYL